MEYIRTVFSLILLLLTISQMNCKKHRKNRKDKESLMLATHQIAWINGTADLECHTPDTLTDEDYMGISWYKDDLTISENDDTRYTLSGNDRHFSIYDLMAEDSGVYSCEAAFGNGPVRFAVSLTVADPDKIKGSLLEVWNKQNALGIQQNLLGNAPYRRTDIVDHPIRKGFKGGNLKLPCDIIGNPSVDYAWYKNGRPIPAGGPGRSRSVYRLDNLETSDAGNYTCVATNYFGNLTRSFTVEVDSCMAEAPKILSTTPVNPVVQLHAEVQLECIIENCRDAPRVAWFKQAPGSGIVPMDTRDMLHITQCIASPYGELNRYRCSYVISNFTAADAGVYLCHARNTLEREDIHRVTLELDQRQDQEKQRETVTYLYYILGGVVFFIVIFVGLACWCARCGTKTHCPKGSSGSALPNSYSGAMPKSRSSTFRRQIAPDYIVSGHHHYEPAHYSVTIPVSPASSKDPGRIGVPMHHALRDPLLENCSPDPSMIKFDGAATEYEDIQEDISVYDYRQRPCPSLASGYDPIAPAFTYYR
ncbi:hypothetical protein BV898_12792 [Hypsibius exemplaris]|uniref:Ig-like domain-containing protein n=1 Tax=Hypsibius exemplaris TaxID=2072580 RepID=A0A1W0WCK5_HYPEX|nr:hypothetical protein BV898_12792 [Hypsibius exemplaris]